MMPTNSGRPREKRPPQITYTKCGLNATITRAAARFLTKGGCEWVMLIRDEKGIAIRPVFTEPELVCFAKLRKPSDGRMMQLPVGKLKLEPGTYGLEWCEEDQQARLIPTPK